MRRAWPYHAARPGTHGIREFFQACSAFKGEGKLLSLWEDPDNTYQNTTVVAARYAQRLQSHRSYVFE
jgi:hypothetical protein